MSNTKVRYPAVEQFIDNNKDALVRSVQEIVRFPSVEAPAAGPGAPFGEAVRGALENALNLGKSFGFETTNLDGYAGCIDYGCGEEMLGVVAHVDVVPEGEGWIHPPYAAEIADGRIYGRGTMDDKGPAVCAIYALAAIKAAGIPMRRRVRIILGTNEETGWGCMDHYRKVAEIPTLTFSPDADAEYLGVFVLKAEPVVDLFVVPQLELYHHVYFFGDFNCSHAEYLARVDYSHAAKLYKVSDVVRCGADKTF